MNIYVKIYLYDMILHNESEVIEGYVFFIICFVFNAGK